jgi:exosome complex component RRP40
MDTNSSKNEELANSFLVQTAKKVNLGFKPVPVMPGEDVTSSVTSGSKSIKIGPGLVQVGSRVQTVAPGVLKYRAPSNYWVETNRKRYYPKVDDQIVGLIEQVAGDFYTVNIFSGSNCILNRQAFEGATKRNKPELKRGDILYARVIKANKDCDIELSCISTTGSKKEWSTGETVRVQ